MSLKKGNRAQLKLQVQFNSGDQMKPEKSLPTFESDIQKFDSKGSHQTTNILSDHDYAEKLHSFVSLASGHDFKDLKVLNKLAEFNDHAKTELDNLKGGHFASDALNQTQFKAPKSDFSSNFESYSRVQRLVDKVIKDTVYSLEKDLNVLPEKQQANNVIDRLSSLHLSKLQLQKQQKEQEQNEDNNVFGSSTVKLPRILNKLAVKQFAAKQTKKRIVDIEDTAESFFEKSSADMNQSSFQPKALAGFYLKEKRQKPKVNREKDELRKKCLDNFFNSHGKVKDISENYLFNLTQYNTHNNTSDPLDTEDTENTEHPIITTSKPVLPKLKNQRKEYFSPKTIPSRTNNVSNSMTNMSHLVSPKNINKSSYSIAKSSYIDKSRPHIHEIDMSKDLFFGEDDSLERALAKKEEMIFEGMGLLTLQTQNKMVPKNLTKFSLDTFSLSVKNLRKSDYDYIEAKTGVNLGHQLYDKIISENDVMRFNADDLQKMF